MNFQLGYQKALKAALFIWVNGLTSISLFHKLLGSFQKVGVINNAAGHQFDNCSFYMYIGGDEMR